MEEEKVETNNPNPMNEAELNFLGRKRFKKTAFRYQKTLEMIAKRRLDQRRYNKANKERMHKRAFKRKPGGFVLEFGMKRKRGWHN